MAIEGTNYCPASSACVRCLRILCTRRIANQHSFPRSFSSPAHVRVDVLFLFYKKIRTFVSADSVGTDVIP